MSNPNSKTVKVLSILTLVIVFYPFVTFADVFNLDLHYGVTHSEVRTLQQFLNLDVRTKLADSGVGSPGSETEYFGSRTADAVRRFQVLYKSEILTPIDLEQGTGYVGSLTRRVLNSVASVIGFVPQAPATVATGLGTGYNYTYGYSYQSQALPQSSIPTSEQVTHITNYVTNTYGATSTATTTGASDSGYDPYAYSNYYPQDNSNPRTPTPTSKKDEPKKEAASGGSMGGGGGGGSSGGSSTSDAKDGKKDNSLDNFIRMLLLELVQGGLMPGQAFPTADPNYDPLDPNGQYSGQVGANTEDGYQGISGPVDLLTGYCTFFVNARFPAGHPYQTWEQVVRMRLRNSPLVDPKFQLLDAQRYFPNGHITEDGWVHVIAGIIELESGFNPNDATAPAGEQSFGLFSLAHPEVPGGDAFNPIANLNGGMNIFINRVAKDHAITGKNASGWAGASSYWSVLRSYCEKGRSS